MGDSALIGAAYSCRNRPPMKDDRIYLLHHIRDAIRQIVEYTAIRKEEFCADRKTQDAVVRNLEIIGEATKRLS